jgi:hypothetical protein
MNFCSDRKLTGSKDNSSGNGKKNGDGDAVRGCVNPRLEADPVGLAHGPFAAIDEDWAEVY